MLPGLSRWEGVVSAQLPSTLAPRAGAQMVTIAVLVANRAGAKVTFRLIERKAPCQPVGACFRLAMSILKTVPKQLLQGWMQYFKGWCTGLRAKGHPSPSTI